MGSHKIFARRMLLATVGTGAVLLGTSLPAQAQPKPPNCTAADLAGIMSGITAATSAYLFTHPPVNDFMTNLGDMPREEKQAALGSFLDSNPAVKTDLQGIRQPAVDFRNRCGGPAPLIGQGPEPMTAEG
ncbi:membrane protein [Mycolicibacterium cyprinidarum]|uniref:Membrane protein n=1 Tax=Mycolicibacterium cyprinidarum TaxID=2860311 RepID=A0ABQ4V4U6_9MYCO|nr:membrane protein [Mycolicibacterium sp. NGTWSNA01]GJF11791.1 membrane protein [Mycolicibacterium sp. NGTWS0302]GJF17122.1 membrane protein [Mycolicibacterium sp. NGTWS1803]